jgi:hypothetical protein
MDLVRLNKNGLELNGTHQLLVCANVNLLFEYINTTNRSTEAFSDGSKEVHPKVNAKKAMHIFMPSQKNGEQNHDIYKDS